MKKSKVQYDFSGYATKNDLKCSDGRIIKKDAFKECDGKKVPLVWQHMHNDPENVLGHAVLENKSDGVYAYCKFNNSKAGKNAKQLVEHGDIDSLSIWANKLVEKGSNVIHGVIRELSLVLSGANEGAKIDNLCIQHGDGTEDVDVTEALIFSGIPLKGVILKHDDDDDDDDDDDEDMDLDDDDDDDDDNDDDDDDDDDGIDHSSEETVGDVLKSMTAKQRAVVYGMLSHVKDNKNVKHTSIKGGNKMKKNVFQGDANKDKEVRGKVLSHADIKAIFDDAQKTGSLKESFLAHEAVISYGIENIDILFPDAKTVTPTPDFIKRDTGWVSVVINGAKHSPFSRIKSTSADITMEEARALGYVKGALKKEEYFSLAARVTTPTTLYKKQKLDRDDIIDITDLDVVAFMKAEMRLMFDEELARAALLGDGRDAASPDKIKEPLPAGDGAGIRSIYGDADMYVHRVLIDPDDTVEDFIDTIVMAMGEYKGTGTPTLFTTKQRLTEMLLLKDSTKRRLYNSVSELANALLVDKIVTVPQIATTSRTVALKEYALKGIVVDMADYVFGADKGGNLSMFDDFDIDYNQYKYLMEARCSGALIHPKTAIVLEQEVVNG
jgi:hypothetical protein